MMRICLPPFRRGRRGPWAVVTVDGPNHRVKIGSMGWRSIVAEGSGIASEGGAVVFDDEHAEGARITLERGSVNAPFAITCGIYGWMVHTRYLGDDAAARRDFADMKRDLAAILTLIPQADATSAQRDAVIAAIERFVAQYP